MKYNELIFLFRFRGHKNIKRQPTGLTKEVFYSLAFTKLENMVKEFVCISMLNAIKFSVSFILKTRTL